VGAKTLLSKIVHALIRLAYVLVQNFSLISFTSSALVRINATMIKTEHSDALDLQNYQQII
jgi:hypothetical protein